MARSGGGWRAGSGYGSRADMGAYAKIHCVIPVRTPSYFPVRQSPGRFMAKSSRYPVPVISRRTLLTGAAAAAAFARLATLPATAQSLNPYDYIVPMDAKPEFGTPVAQAAQGPVEDQGALWDAYLQMPIKEGQDLHLMS